ncbi:MAG TPA: hypothetical protein VE223_08260, partial [Nitrososphaeraceae archaeon]|nr:hypothetical protein [Nitrososphaeraceae archaeon]
KFNMSEYTYEGKIHSDDRVNYKTIYSSDGIKVGEVEAAFSDSFIVKLEKEQDTEIKYEIPRVEILTLTDERVTLKLTQSEINEKYQTSSINKSSITKIKDVIVCIIGIKKPTELGISECMLRFMAWLCMEYVSYQFII